MHMKTKLFLFAAATYESLNATGEGQISMVANKKAVD